MNGEKTINGDGTVSENYRHRSSRRRNREGLDNDAHLVDSDEDRYQLSHQNISAYDSQRNQTIAVEDGVTTVGIIDSGEQKLTNIKINYANNDMRQSQNH